MAGVEKIAILGGGLGSLTAAYYLTSDPDWKSKYEITVYQMGWRLGGKGASGRGPNDRIQEHGLHLWLGFYDNAFRMMEEIYADVWAKKLGAIPKFEDAYEKHDFVVFGEKLTKGWALWRLLIPPNEEKPGYKCETPELWDIVQMAMAMLVDHFGKTKRKRREYEDKMCADMNPIRHVLMHIKLTIEDLLISLAFRGLRNANQVVQDLQGAEGIHDKGEHAHVLNALHSGFRLIERLLQKHLENDDELRHLFIVTDIVRCTVRGLIVDGAVDSPEGLDVIDKWDLREWLARHGANPITVNSGALQGVYDLVFAYEDGDPERPRLAAGVALRGVLRMAFRYKGSFFYKMTAGMGDIVFTPTFYALKERGVKFKFFHKVENLGVSADKEIESIDMWRQATVIAGDDNYEPFVDVKGIDCWPADPKYALLKEGKELEERKINLESYWTNWDGGEKFTLRKGEHFDRVVLGISIGAFPFMATELAKADDSWKTMVENLGTVRTMAMQLWLQPELHRLGWQNESPTLDGYAQPHNTWADMTHLLVRENWGGELDPKTLAYYCGPHLGKNDLEVDPAEQDRLVREIAKDWLAKHTGFLWPEAVPAKGDPGLDLMHLIGESDTSGDVRLHQQYFRANIDPSERYVLSLPGTTQYRKRPGESGFGNMVIAGDWTQNDLNAGCVEAAVMSGMLASQAVCGSPKDEYIVGRFHP